MTISLLVLIYFNGDGLLVGSGSEPRYAGQIMVRKMGITATIKVTVGFCHKDY